jgi:hypothetical protein
MREEEPDVVHGMGCLAGAQGPADQDLRTREIGHVGGLGLIRQHNSNKIESITHRVGGPNGLRYIDRETSDG